jgi:hypothetical protein
MWKWFAMKKLLAAATLTAAVIVLAACSAAPPPATESKTEATPKKELPAGPVTAKTAFYEMYKPARAWAPDFMLLSLVSNDVPGVPSDAGKFGMWTAVFVSPGRNEARTFTYSAVDSGTTIHKGVDASGPQSWSGATAASRPFQTMDFTTDSDAAYQTAMEKAGAWVKAHPAKQAAFTLANASRFPTPVWYIVWGDKASGYSVLVSATTGTMVKSK